MMLGLGILSAVGGWLLGVLAVRYVYLLVERCAPSRKRTIRDVGFDPFAGARQAVESWRLLIQFPCEPSLRPIRRNALLCAGTAFVLIVLSLPLLLVGLLSS